MRKHLIDKPINYIKQRISIDSFGCWNWCRYVNKYGYGQIGIMNGNKTLRAHRFSFETFKYKIPEGLVIDHICRNRKCVNPEHLRAVTQKENLNAEGSKWKHAKK